MNHTVGIAHLIRLSYRSKIWFCGFLKGKSCLITGVAKTILKFYNAFDKGPESQRLVYRVYANCPPNNQRKLKYTLHDYVILSSRF